MTILAITYNNSSNSDCFDGKSCVSKTSLDDFALKLYRRQPAYSQLESFDANVVTFRLKIDIKEKLVINVMSKTLLWLCNTDKDYERC